VEDGARLASEERLDDRTPDTLALPRRHDGDRRELLAAVPVRFDLAQPDYRAILRGDHEIRPVEAHAVQVGLLDEAADNRLVGFDRGADGHAHRGERSRGLAAVRVRHHHDNANQHHHKAYDKHRVLGNRDRGARLAWPFVGLVARDLAGGERPRAGLCVLFGAFLGGGLGLGACLAFADY